MKICFFGTGSSYPTPSRGASSLCLQLDDGAVWLFDCGEGTQIQIQKSSFSLHKLRKIFISHLHGDHLFGLPGLLCSKSAGNTLSTSEEGVSKPCVDIYGPVGLQKYIYHSLSLSRSQLDYNYAVYELEPVACQFPKDWADWNVDHSRLSHRHPSEVTGGVISATQDEKGNHTWQLFENECFTVTAGMIMHRVPCFGYVIKEKSKTGSLQVEKLKKLGLMPGPDYGKLKSGSCVEVNGKIINPSDAIGPPIPGRTVVVLGDTSDAYGMSHLVSQCDVLIHEATHDNTLEEKASCYGHSTPSGAVKMAKVLAAQTLILNHFSQRYKENSDETVESLQLLKDQAMQCLSGHEMKIVMAKDLLCYDIPIKRLPS